MDYNIYSNYFFLVGEGNINLVEIDYEGLDKKTTNALNLSEDSFFVLSNGVEQDLFEFVYPSKLRGNMIPINTKSLVGRAVISKRFYLSNNIKKEKGFISLSFIMEMGGAPVQKVLIYPVEFGGRIVAVLEAVRRGDSLTEAPDFGEEDITRIKEVISEFFSLRVAEEMDQG